MSANPQVSKHEVSESFTTPAESSQTFHYGYYRTAATYEGQPVYFNPERDDLAYEPLQDARLVSLPDHVEDQVRRRLRYPKRAGYRKRLHKHGEFIALTPDMTDWTDRRGMVICSDAIGLTVRVVGHGDEVLAETYDQLWPWGTIIVVTRVVPTEAERDLLKGN